jgi:hypothetical protein
MMNITINWSRRVYCHGFCLSKNACQLNAKQLNWTLDDERKMAFIYK